MPSVEGFFFSFPATHIFSKNKIRVRLQRSPLVDPMLNASNLHDNRVVSTKKDGRGTTSRTLRDFPIAALVINLLLHVQYLYLRSKQGVRAVWHLKNSLESAKNCPVPVIYQGGVGKILVERELFDNEIWNICCWHRTLFVVVPSSVDHP